MFHLHWKSLCSWEFLSAIKSRSPVLEYQPDLQSSSEYQSGLLFSHHTTFLRLTDISMKQYLYYCNILHFIFQHLWQWQSKIVSDSLSQESLYQVPLVLFAFFFFFLLFSSFFLFYIFPFPWIMCLLREAGEIEYCIFCSVCCYLRIWCAG